MNIIDNNVFEVSFCERCLYLFKNGINQEKDNEGVDSSKAEILISLNAPPLIGTKCKFCFGILNVASFPDHIEKIKQKINEYDFNDFKIVTNFSPLFEIIHYYWRSIMNKRKSLHSFSSIDQYDISMLRKAFKPLFSPFVSNQTGINAQSSMRSEFEIRVIFDFIEEFYDKIYEIFSFIPVVKKMTGSKFKPQASYDKSYIKDLIKNCSSDLMIELVNKYQLLDIDSIQGNPIIDVKIELVNQNIFIKGNYTKLSRDIGQSPWEVNGVKICASSVEEEMKKTLQGIFQGEDCVMSAGGREDRDVRMLGNGRPFVIEVINPKKKFEPLKNIKKMEEEINSNTSLIKVINLDSCDKNYFAVLKQYEDSKKKLYSCVVWAAKTLTGEDIDKINSISDLQVIQKTPIRVMHRRALMDRNKIIFKMKAELINENFMIVNILSSAGTYIKEFVHSDLGRTNPNLMSILGCECDILQLDVLDIYFEKK